ncbi:unnamed protein product, partial [Urochloa humidicola]
CLDCSEGSVLTFVDTGECTWLSSFQEIRRGLRNCIISHDAIKTAIDAHANQVRHFPRIRNRFQNPTMRQVYNHMINGDNLDIDIQRKTMDSWCDK